MFKKRSSAKCGAKRFGKIAAVIALWNCAFAAIDVVIPAIAKDKGTLDLAIEGIKENGVDIRRVIVISPEKLTDKAEWFPEEKFPFDKTRVAKAIHPKITRDHDRLGWVLQQLLKLYAPFVIPDISDNVLILDADTVFIKRVNFLRRAIPLYSYIYGNHPTYINHIKRLLPGFEPPITNFSGVCHHMLFQKVLLEKLFREIRGHHGMEPWEAICKCIKVNELGGSCFSEYELYFQYAFRHGKARARKLRAQNYAASVEKEWKKFRKEGLQVVSFHNSG